MHRLGDSGVHTLGDTSAFVNPAGQLLLIAINSGLIAEWMASAYYLNYIYPLFINTLFLFCAPLYSSSKQTFVRFRNAFLGYIGYIYLTFK